MQKEYDSLVVRIRVLEKNINEEKEMLSKSFITDSIAVEVNKWKAINESDLKKSVERKNELESRLYK